MEDGGYFRRIRRSLLFEGQRLQLNVAHHRRLPPTSELLAEDAELKHGVRTSSLSPVPPCSLKVARLCCAASSETRVSG